MFKNTMKILIFKFLDFENFKTIRLFDKEFGFVDKECFINSFKNKKIPRELY